MVEDALSLADWRRRISELYVDVRRSGDPEAAWTLWRSARDDLFENHPQSPIPPDDRPAFGGITYFPYDRNLRVAAELHETEPLAYEIPTSGEGTMAFTRFATARSSLGDHPIELEVYWLEGYGGGLFLPFRDATSGSETYGAGRYLFDAIKGADLGMEDGALILDFNFAYNPSCSYDPRWVCPLAPPANRLEVRIEAGERSG